jgi:hypothetical protein
MLKLLEKSLGGGLAGENGDGGQNLDGLAIDYSIKSVVIPALRRDLAARLARSMRWIPGRIPGQARDDNQGLSLKK